MKRYGNLYPLMYDLDNIRLAHKNAKRGKAHYKEVQMINSNIDTYVNAIHYMLKDKTFRNAEYTIFIKNDNGKLREIYKLPYYPDRIVHHCIMQILEPIWMSVFITDTYSSLKGRGIHRGVKRLQKALQDIENTTYCLKLDIRKFYPSIDHSILKSIIRKKIKDSDVLWLLDVLIDSTSGIPIGNYLSQYFGNLYLAYFDHWMKEGMQCKYYFRYCDDIIILHKDKEVLHNLLVDIDAYLYANLKLVIKHNYRIFPVDACGIDFLGYVFYHTHTLARKAIVKRFKKKIAYVLRNYKCIKAFAITSSIMSYAGWFIHCNSKNLIKSYITKRVKFIICGGRNGYK